MPTLKQQRETFIRGLLPILDEYIRGGSAFLQMVKGGRTHATSALAMKTQILSYLSAVLRDDHTAGHQWLALIQSLRTFHSGLQAGQSQELLTGIDQYVDDSDYPDIFTNTLLFDANILASLNTITFNPAAAADADVYTPVDVQRLMHDLDRYQNIITVTQEGKTCPLTDWIKIEKMSNDTDEVEIYKIINMVNGESKTFEQVNDAIEHISMLFGAHFKDAMTFTHLVSYLSQNAVLTTLSQDFLSLVRYTGLQMMGDITLSPLNEVTDMQTVNAANIENNSGFQIDEPKKFFNIGVDDQGPVITVVYIFDQYRILGGDHDEDDEPISFLTPMQVEERFHCILTPDGQEARIQHDKSRFTLVNDMAVSEQKPDTKQTMTLV